MVKICGKCKNSWSFNPSWCQIPCMLSYTFPSLTNHCNSTCSEFTIYQWSTQHSKSHFGTPSKKNTLPSDWMDSIFHSHLVQTWWYVKSPMVNFVTLMPPCILWTPQSPAAMHYFSKNRNKINIFCTLSAINKTHDKAVNINDNFEAISTLENNKKLYITCLQFSYSLALCFPYDIIHLPDRCEANAVTSVLPSNNWLNVDSIIKASENKLGFNSSYSKLDHFSLMQ